MVLARGETANNIHVTKQKWDLTFVCEMLVLLTFSQGEMLGCDHSLSEITEKCFC